MTAGGFLVTGPSFAIFAREGRRNIAAVHEYIVRVYTTRHFFFFMSRVLLRFVIFHSFFQEKSYERSYGVTRSSFLFVRFVRSEGCCSAA